MSSEGFEVIKPSTFEKVDEWATPAFLSQELPNDYLQIFFPNLSELRQTLLDLYNHLNGGPTNAIGPWQQTSVSEPDKAKSVDDDLIDMDISREMRWLGFPESEIKRWELVKKIERKTGKRCDDYV